jgi:uncharacterized membrane protein YdjX (TVP38/TMEM64 family)
LLIIAVGVLVALVAAGSLVPVPSPAELRTWAEGAGWATPLLFFGVYAVLTVAPIPRSVFNLSAGLLLGEVVGLVVAMLATALAACLALVLARGLGRRWVESQMERDSVRAISERLSGGGTAGVMSLRLIPMIPFAPVNYCCGVSAMRIRPFMTGTVIGSLPGTIAAVILGDALTGTTPPTLLAVYIGLAAIGTTTLIVVLRRQSPRALVSDHRVLNPEH